MKNRITDILGIEFPLIQGPMRLITLGETAAIISNSGGFGQIAASGLSTDKLRSEVKKASELTNKPFGINIPIYRPNAYDVLEIAIETGLKAITTCAGNPAKLIGRIKEAGLKVFHKASTVEMAKKAEACGVDGIIATGFEAGGHVGREWVTNFCLVPQLVDTVKIPVVSAGGVADARGLLAAFALGAEGVEIGTVILSTRECQVPDFFKQLIIDAGSDSTVLLGKKTMPMRVLRNKAAELIGGPDKLKEDRKLDSQGDKKYIAEEGVDADSAIMPCGQISGLIREIKSMGEMLPEMMEKAQILSLQLQDVFQDKNDPAE